MNNSKPALETLIDKMAIEGLGKKYKCYKYVILYANKIIYSPDIPDMVYMETLNDLLNLIHTHGFEKNKYSIFKDTIEYAESSVQKDKKLDDENMLRSIVYILDKKTYLDDDLKEWLDIAKEKY